MATKTKWNLIAKIRRAKNRKKIFLDLDGPILPSELVKKIYGKTSNFYFNLVSRALSELKKLGLVKVKNPRNRTGRLYELTEIGKKIKKEFLKK